MISIDLTGRTLLMSGALGAIAEFIVRRLTQAGATVFCTDIVPPDVARETLDRWGIPSEQSPYAVMDVTDGEATEQATRQAIAHLGRIDICLGHAGGCGMHPFMATPPEEYERIFRFNYFGQVNLTRSVLRLWREAGCGGHMIYTSSLVAAIPWPDLAAYNSAKAALEMMARTLALENAEYGIRFNTVAPGHVAAGSALRVYEEDETYRRMVANVIPSKRLVRPEAIGDTFLWLCSSLSEEVNGQVINVDLGASLPKLGGDV